MLLTIIAAPIILSYFIIRAVISRKLKAGESTITAILCIGITAYFILFIVTGV